MYLKLRSVGVLSLALGIALAPLSALAATDGKAPKSGFDKLVEAKFGDKVKVNDYSSMGATYGSPEGEKTANEAAKNEGPTVNDYSSMGARYGEPAGKSGAADKTQKSPADAADAGNVTTEMLVEGHGRFNGNCAQCHGQDGVGSTFAPSLVTRLKGMDKAQFVDVVTNGKTVFNSSTGSYSVMPAWAGNEEVMGHLDEIWAYLKARSDGELGTGRPK